MASVKLSYTDPEIAGAANTTFTGVLVVKGWYEPDDFKIIAFQHEHLDGSMSEQSTGKMRRIITLDFGVVTDFAKRKAILYFLMDSARQINLVMSAPANFTATPNGEGIPGLAADTYYYRVTAVDDVGETVGATEDSAVVTGTGDTNVDLVWDAVSGATAYRIYRSDTTGTYGGVHFLEKVTGVTANDTGAVTLTSTYQLPSVQALTVVTENFQGLVAEWVDGYKHAKRFVIRVSDASVRSTLIP
jgi:hypothetical protein